MVLRKTVAKQKKRIERTHLADGMLDGLSDGLLDGSFVGMLVGLQQVGGRGTQNTIYI